MFGDDLKKSLEPIKTSDELLAKTRLAIEKARLEQAKASLEPAHTEPKKRSSSFGFSWKMVVPIACALLVVGGAVMVTDYLGKAKKAESKDKIKTHNQEIASLDKQLDAAVGGDRYNYAADTTVASVEHEAEDVEGLDWENSPVMEETTAAESSEAASKGNHQKSDGSMSVRPSKASEFYASVQVDGSLLCISDDRHSLFLADPMTGNPIPDEKGKQVPDFSFLDEDQKIQGLNYLENYGLLFVSVSSDQAWSKQSIEHLYICSYKDGVLQSETPESCD